MKLSYEQLYDLSVKDKNLLFKIINVEPCPMKSLKYFKASYFKKTKNGPNYTWFMANGNNFEVDIIK